MLLKKDTTENVWKKLQVAEDKNLHGKDTKIKLNKILVMISIIPMIIAYHHRRKCKSKLNLD